MNQYDWLDACKKTIQIRDIVVSMAGGQIDTVRNILDCWVVCI